MLKALWRTRGLLREQKGDLHVPCWQAAQLPSKAITESLHGSGLWAAVPQCMDEGLAYSDDQNLPLSCKDHVQ